MRDPLLDAERDALKKKGYRFEVTVRGYSVYFKDEFVHGAGIKGPYKGRGNQIEQDLQDHLRSAVASARQHAHTLTHQKVT